MLHHKPSELPTENVGTPMNGTRIEGTVKEGTEVKTYGPGSAFHGKAGRSGAPQGNKNAIRHGLSGSQLPKGCKSIENRVNKLREQLEAAIMAARGRVTLTDAAHITTAMKWETHAALALRWLRKADKLTPTEQLTFSREAARASAERDRAIAALDLDRDASESILDILYKRQPQIVGPGTADGSGGTNDK